jgi:hypothetical protein
MRAAPTAARVRRPTEEWIMGRTFKGKISAHIRASVPDWLRE